MSLYNVLQYDVTQGIMWRHESKLQYISLRQCSVLTVLPQSQVRSPHFHFSLCQTLRKTRKTESKNSVCRLSTVPYHVNDCGLFSGGIANMLVDTTTFRMCFLLELQWKVATWTCVNLWRNQKGLYLLEENAHIPVIPKTLQIKVSVSTLFFCV